MNEPGSVPSSFAINLIFNFCLNFGVHFIAPAFLDISYHSLHTIVLLLFRLQHQFQQTATIQNHFVVMQDQLRKLMFRIQSGHLA